MDTEYPRLFNQPVEVTKIDCMEQVPPSLRLLLQPSSTKTVKSDGSTATEIIDIGTGETAPAAAEGTFASATASKRLFTRTWERSAMHRSSRQP